MNESHNASMTYITETLINITSTLMEVDALDQMSYQFNQWSMIRDKVLAHDTSTSFIPQASKPESSSVELLKAIGKTMVPNALVEKLEHSPAYNKFIGEVIATNQDPRETVILA